ncbi:MAG: response regulator transcription factor [Alphaproteobacteria bacterium]|nr:response regulator transcription factor [Alphaproteobacteria bacterium]
MRILLIEDEFATATRIIRLLSQSLYQIDHVATGKEGLALALDGHYDIILLDRLLPDLDGIAIVQSLRAKNMTVPVMILSMLVSVEERVKGIKAGADDYLGKPFDNTELLARLDNLSKRQNLPPALTRLFLDDLEMDLITRQVTRGGRVIELQLREFTLLEYLLRHKEGVVTRAMLLENVWDFHFDPQTNVIDVHISRLRQKIDRGFAVPLLHTIRGVGYTMRIQPKLQSFQQLNNQQTVSADLGKV